MVNIFKRYEIKYLLNKDQYLRLITLYKDKIKLDKYGKSLICNIYYDTDSFLLIRSSIEKPIYKEKIRLRTYNLSSPYFLELKKKYDSIVYKRRVDFSSIEEVNDFLINKKANSQIEKEIKYSLNYYQDIKPKMFISYYREAYYGESNLRITFDFDILYRDYDLDFSKGNYGNNILENNQILMEIKIEEAMPLWLCKFLTKEKLYSISFSKYGASYKKIMKGKMYV